MVSFTSELVLVIYDCMHRIQWESIGELSRFVSLPRIRLRLPRRRRVSQEPHLREHTRGTTKTQQKEEFKEKRHLNKRHFLKPYKTKKYHPFQIHIRFKPPQNDRKSSSVIQYPIVLIFVIRRRYTIAEPTVSRNNQRRSTASLLTRLIKQLSLSQIELPRTV